MWFRPFTVNVIIETAGFTSVVLLFVCPACSQFSLPFSDFYINEVAYDFISPSSFTYKPVLHFVILVVAVGLTVCGFSLSQSTFEEYFTASRRG